MAHKHFGDINLRITHDALSTENAEPGNVLNDKVAYNKKTRSNFRE